MTEPRRLRQGGGPSQRLLDSASLDVPGRTSRQRAALLASTAGAFSSTAGPARPAQKRGAVRTLFTWVSIGAAASIGLAFAGSRLFDAPRGHAGSTTAPMAELPSTGSHPSEIAPEVVRQRVEPWVSAPLPPAPAYEAHQVEAARRAVGQGDAAAALVALSQTTNEPAVLRPEAMVLRVQALEMSAKHADAQALAREFVAAYPRHPLVERVQPLAR
jgi:hypothetical protein